MFKKSLAFSFLLPFLFLSFNFVRAEIYEEYQATWSAKVLEVVNQETRRIPGTENDHLYQTLKVEINEGPKKGEIIQIENDFLKLEKGDKFFMNYLRDISGVEVFTVTNVDRRGGMIFLALLFIAVIVVFGGGQGIRSLIALATSFLVIFFVLIPGILGGWNPIWASLIVAGGILFGAIFFTHGFNRESLVAYSGTMIAVFITTLLAIFAVGITSLTGFASDESVYLNFNTGGNLNFTSLLLGAIIIGILGVLDDIAVTQSAVVTEIYSSNKNLSKREVFRKAMRVGREHVGALVNTLVLAYTGASLPLLLLIYTNESKFTSTINMEIFATEVVRTIVGSIGLVLTVPIVTFLAVIYLKKYAGALGQNGLCSHGHSHSHSHGHSHSHHH